MKKSLILMLALAGSLAADASGIWNGKGTLPDPKYGHIPVTAQLTILQAGTSLKGTFKAGNGKPVPITGTVSGTQVTFAVASGAVTANLQQNGTQLTGTMTSNAGMVATMVFTQK